MARAYFNRDSGKFELLVKDIMSTPPITCEENTAIGEVIKRMIKHNVGSVVVIKNKKPIGIITERDIRRYLSKRSNLLVKAKNIMSQPVKVIKEEAKVTDAARLMADYGIRKLPVVNSSGEVVGVITEGDIVRHANRKGRFIEESWRNRGINKSFTVKTPQNKTEWINTSPPKSIFKKIVSAILKVISHIVRFFIRTIIIVGFIVVFGAVLIHLGGYTPYIEELIYPINSKWVHLFFANISSYRGKEYIYCPSLSQFAQIRFNTIISNYEISHYGMDEDCKKYGIYTVEEILFPLGSPSGYLSQLMKNDPLHWQVLKDNSYTYFGYYIGKGPSVASDCNPPPEIPGPNINISEYLKSKGCNPTTITNDYLIIELSKVCST